MQHPKDTAFRPLLDVGAALESLVRQLEASQYETEIRRMDVQDQVDAAVADATTAVALERRSANGQQASGAHFPRPAAGHLRRHVAKVDALSGWLDEDEAWAAKAPARCARLLLRRASTTGFAIALLLDHGYSEDAPARSRALIDLEVTARLLAGATEREYLAQRFLLHAGSTHPDVDAFLLIGATDTPLQGGSCGWSRERSHDSSPDSCAARSG